ncbi:circular bacteriocin, circularin A/uberolysin family [Bacillus cereus]|uniref:circular bacteriocin, circularin A/uberolysin family n=1 Tax=Bacillus cereus group TaxID=86661 RepID=UPI0030131168
MELDVLFEIAKNFDLPNSTAEKVYNAVNNGADAWAVASIIIAATGPFSIGIGAVYMLIKNQMKKTAASVAIAW